MTLTRVEQGIILLLLQCFLPLCLCLGFRRQPCLNRRVGCMQNQHERNMHQHEQMNKDMGKKAIYKALATTKKQRSFEPFSKETKSTKLNHQPKQRPIQQRKQHEATNYPLCCRRNTTHHQKTSKPNLTPSPNSSLQVGRLHKILRTRMDNFQVWEPRSFGQAEWLRGAKRGVASRRCTTQRPGSKDLVIHFV